MSVFDVEQDYRATPVFEHMVKYLFGQLTAALGVVRFVQVGANDGIADDPIRDFVRSGKWSGLMVEPVPSAFEKLLKNNSGRKGLKFANCAVGLTNGKATFYACREPQTNLSSFDKATIIKHNDWAESNGNPRPGDHIDEITVSVRTIESLCAEHRISRPDILVIDAEGHDCKAIQSADIETRRPKLIFFEHKHCSDDETSAVRDRLKAAGYELLYDKYNAMAVKQRKFFPAPLIKTFREILIDAANVRSA